MDDIEIEAELKRFVDDLEPVIEKYSGSWTPGELKFLTCSVIVHWFKMHGVPSEKKPVGILSLED